MDERPPIVNSTFDFISLMLYISLLWPQGKVQVVSFCFVAGTCLAVCMTVSCPYRLLIKCISYCALIHLGGITICYYFRLAPTSPICGSNQQSTSQLHGGWSLVIRIAASITYVRSCGLHRVVSITCFIILVLALQCQKLSCIVHWIPVYHLSETVIIHRVFICLYQLKE